MNTLLITTSEEAVKEERGPESSARLNKERRVRRRCGSSDRLRFGLLDLRFVPLFWRFVLGLRVLILGLRL